MTVTFTVETGNADPDSNSYVDLETASDYISTNNFVANTWAGLTETQQQFLLIRATGYIDNLVQWNGKRVDQDSGLRWPRSCVYDPDGFEYPNDAIPALLQDAVSEFAAILAGGDDWTQKQPTWGMKEVKIDTLEIQYDTLQVRPSLPDYVIEMLSPLGSVQRGIRPAFKKINRY